MFFHQFLRSLFLLICINFPVTYILFDEMFLFFCSLFIIDPMLRATLNTFNFAIIHKQSSPFGEKSLLTWDSPFYNGHILSISKYMYSVAVMKYSI